MKGRALIIGGGIGGLATGRALRSDGWDVQIRERTGALPETGTALGMWPEAIAALDRLGIGDHVRQQGQRQDGGRLLRPDGTVIAGIPTREPVYLISRPELHRLLHGQELAQAVTWAAPVTNLDEVGQVDLLVGADGINSTVREVVTGSPTAIRPLGTVAFRGVVPGPVDAVTETWGRGRLFGITPHDAERTNWFASVRVDLLPEREQPRADIDLLRHLFDRWHPGVAAVLDRIEAGGVDRRTLSDVAPLRSYVRGNVAIVGDAAHAMAPNAGRGACEALVDAVALADALRSADSVQNGLRQYDAVRRKPTQRVVAVSRALNRIATMKRGTRLRNGIVAAASSASSAVSRRSVIRAVRPG